MVETRNRRKSAAASVAAAGGGGDAAPSSSGQQAAAAGHDGVDYAELYRQQHQQHQQHIQSNILRQLKSRIHLAYQQQAMTWGWYMLEPWEIVLWMSLLALVSYLVLSACLLNPTSFCRSSLAAVHNSLVERGAKLLAFTRQR